MVKNKKFVTAGAVAVILICGTMISVSSAANVEPGTNADPLVSKSYVDEKISELLNVLNTGVGTGGNSQNISEQSIIDKVMKQINEMNGEGSTTARYIPVNATKGQTVIGNEGTEIILRSGAAVGYCTGSNGVVNATNGKELFNGNKVEKNNILIVPRDDGRGVKVTSEDAWFIIKGGYSIN